MCNYCERHAQYGDYEVDYLSVREPSKNDIDLYTGISTYIDVDTNELIMFACIDSADVKALHTQKAIPINYCPICGRKLGEKNEVQ